MIHWLMVHVVNDRRNFLICFGILVTVAVVVESTCESMRHDC